MNIIPLSDKSLFRYFNYFAYPGLAYWFFLPVSVLFNAAFVGVPMLIISGPFIIYTMIDVTKLTSSWENYVRGVMSLGRDYSSGSPIPYFHYATGLSSIFI